MADEAKKLSLWDRLRGKTPPPPDPEKAVEEKFYNPLGIKIGEMQSINHVDYSGMDFRVVEIVEYRRTIGGKVFFFTDYILLAQAFDGSENRVILRLLPMDEPQPGSEITHNVILLRLNEEFCYSEDLHKVITDETDDLYMDSEDGEGEDAFWRVNGVIEPYLASCSTIRDENNDGTIEDDEVTSSEVEYWDYYREIEIEGITEVEYLYIEMNKENGWFKIWRGCQIDPTRISA